MTHPATDPATHPETGAVPTGSGRDRGGRPAITSAHDLAEAAQQLFLAKGFEQTSVDDIAAAAGVSRRTFFRYFSSKSDVLWVETPAETRALSAHLDCSPDDEPYAEALTRAVIAALDHPPAERDWALHRAQLIFTVPAVQAQTWQRFTGWREISSAFAGRRCGEPEGLFTLAVGHAVIAATLTAHEYWIAHPGTDLARWLGEALALHLPPPPPAGQ